MRESVFNYVCVSEKECGIVFSLHVFVFLTLFSRTFFFSGNALKPTAATKTSATSLTPSNTLTPPPFKAPRSPKPYHYHGHKQRRAVSPSPQRTSESSDTTSVTSPDIFSVQVTSPDAFVKSVTSSSAMTKSDSITSPSGAGETIADALFVVGSALAGATQRREEEEEKEEKKREEKEKEGGPEREGHRTILTGTVVSISVSPSANVTSAREAFVTSPTSPTSHSDGVIRTGRRYF